MTESVDNCLGNLFFFEVSFCECALAKLSPDAADAVRGTDFGDGADLEDSEFVLQELAAPSILEFASDSFVDFLCVESFDVF